MPVIISAIISIGVLVFIHEGGHFLSAKAFGVRVTEFMLGLPGPNLSFKFKGTKFGVTCIPLGGYARVCGMTRAKLHPRLKYVLASVYRRGEVLIEQVALDAKIDVDEVQSCLEELEQWGCVSSPKTSDEYNVYRTYEAGGKPVEFSSTDALFESEYNKQYRSKKFWQKSLIVLAGIAVNIIFAMIAFVVVYSLIGVDVKGDDGQIVHMTVDPLRSIQAGFTYIYLTIQAIISLLNPMTTAQTVSQSTSIVGIAYLSSDYFSRGLSEALLFMGMISASLGLMNLIPIPPLDGGLFIIEVIKKITRREVPEKVTNVISAVGVGLLLVLFVVTLGQDVQRFIFGSWS